MDTEYWDLEESPATPLKIKEEEDDEPPVLRFNYCYEAYEL